MTGPIEGYRRAPQIEIVAVIGFLSATKNSHADEVSHATV